MNGQELIALERREQIEKHGWTVVHDVVTHEAGVLALAGRCLETCESGTWPWSAEWWQKLRIKPVLERHVIAGALYLAELDAFHHRHKNDLAGQPFNMEREKIDALYRQAVASVDRLLDQRTPAQENLLQSTCVFERHTFRGRYRHSTGGVFTAQVWLEIDHDRGRIRVVPGDHTSQTEDTKFCFSAEPGQAELWGTIAALISEATRFGIQRLADVKTNNTKS